MTLIRRQNNMMPTMNRLFDDFFGKDFIDWANTNFSTTNTTIPAVNVKESNEAYQVEVAAPGMNKEDFKVQLENNLLTISSEKQMSAESKEGEKYTRKEFSYQSFQRSFTLPERLVDEGAIQAKYDNGVLYVLIPKKEEAKQKGARLIEIG